MTKAELRRVMFRVFCSLAVLTVVAAFFEFGLSKRSAGNKLYEFIKDFLPFYLAAAAAYLAYCFQQRSNFLISVREVWKDIVTTKNALIAFTYNEDPSIKEFESVQQRLFITIDLIRAVYKNIDEDVDGTGLYPFEPLHDMRKVLKLCSPHCSSKERREQARTEFQKAWYTLKSSYLKELPRVVPSQPIVVRGFQND